MKRQMYDDLLLEFWKSDGIYYVKTNTYLMQAAARIWENIYITPTLLQFQRIKSVIWKQPDSKNAYKTTGEEKERHLSHMINMLYLGIVEILQVPVRK